MDLDFLDALVEYAFGPRDEVAAESLLKAAIKAVFDREEGGKVEN